MLIDWFTVIAQAVNFLVLVWLLKHFLYRPILDAVDAREHRVTARLGDAQAREREADTVRQQLETELAEARQARASRLQAAAQEAATEKEALLAAARVDANALRTRFEAALAGERESRRGAIARRLQHEVIAVAGQVVRDLAGERLETLIVERFVERLGALVEPERGELAAALSSARQSPRCRSSVALTADDRTRISAALRTLAPETVEPSFETADTLVGGIELVTDGHRFAWSVEDYLDTLERSLTELTAAPEAGRDG